jgi:hypothetical protein
MMFEAVQTYALKIRLLYCQQPLTITAAILDKSNQYVPNFKFTCKPAFSKKHKLFSGQF